MKKKILIALILGVIVAVILATPRSLSVSQGAPAAQQQERQPTRGRQLVENKFSAQQHLNKLLAIFGELV